MSCWKWRPPGGVERGAEIPVRAAPHKLPPKGET